jgi:hypothetical protein
MRSRFAMMNLFILSILVGAVLGMRLKVSILIPAIGFLIAGIAAIGAVRGDGVSSIATAAILAVVSLQLGYLAGSTTRFVTVASRLARRIDGKAKGPQADHRALRA